MSGRRTASPPLARRERRRSIPHPATLAALAGLAAAGVWMIGSSPLLDIRTVEVLGVHRLAADEIQARAAVPLGTPLARLDTVAVRARLIEIPQVADVAVTRRWPHTVRITVEERVPAVAVPDGDRLVLVDRDGVSFETVAKKPAGVPLVVGASASTLGPERVDAAVEVLAALPFDVRKRATEVSVRTVNSVTATLDDGVRVVWGSAADGARKAEVLTALMRTEAKVYDVSSPDAPTTSG